MPQQHRMNPQNSIPDSLALAPLIRIVTRQTTYWDVATDRPEAGYRIHFHGKLEFAFTETCASPIAIHAEHPLLLEYSEPNASIYISTKSSDPDATVSQLSSLAEHRFRGWRSLARYLNQCMPAEEILSKGHGLLLSGPRGFAEAAAQLLASHSVNCRVLSGPLRPSNCSVLELGRNYVVAKSFRFESTQAA